MCIQVAKVATTVPAGPEYGDAVQDLAKAIALVNEQTVSLNQKVASLELQIKTGRLKTVGITLAICAPTMIVCGVLLGAHL